MSVHVTYVAPGEMPQLAADGDLAALSPLRLETGGEAAITVAEGSTPPVALTDWTDVAQRHLVLFVLIDLGGHRTLIYALGEDPVYIDGQAAFAAVLLANSPYEVRHVIRSARLAGAIQIAPAPAVRRAAATNGSCAYCSGSIEVGKPVVVCGCSAEAVVHGADEELDCWKRSTCTKCGWPLTDAEPAEGVEVSKEVDDGTS